MRRSRLPLCVIFIHAAIIGLTAASCAAMSFEGENVPEGWSAADGSLQISSEHYKDGERALAWEWQDGGNLIFSDTAALDEAGAFCAWIYNTLPMDGNLRVRFGPRNGLADGDVPYAFEYPLSFSGWRYIQVDFDEDIPVEGFEGDATVTAMSIQAPPGTSGRILLDLVEFPANALWSRPADRQLPFINPKRDYDWFVRFDNRARDARPQRPASGEEIADIVRIRNRCESWLTGANADRSDPLIQERLNALVETARGSADELAALLEKPLVSQTEFRTVLRHMGVMAVAYRTDAPDNPFYQDAGTRERILDAFRHMHEQGWANGSLFGDARVFRLMTGGYEAAVFLMRDELKTAGLLDQQLEAVRWYSCIGRVFEETDNRGMNADVIRGKYLLCLIYALSVEDPDERAMWMRHLSAWMSRGLLPAPELQDTIKPDYTGFHHGMIVGNSYVIHALHAGSMAQYLLDETTFALSTAATESLREALLAARFYANKYHVPTMLALRWPFVTDSIYRLMPAYAYEALTDDTDDRRMQHCFARLWDPDVPDIAEKSLHMGVVGYCYMGTMGAVEAVRDAAAMNAAPERPPGGFRFFPYGALAVHRRGDWMVATKGWSKYVKNYEQQHLHRSGTSGRNIHGRYTSHGTTEIYCAGDPVSRAASGYVEDGWDWNRWPGTTAIYLPWEELYEKVPYGRQQNKETFVGAVSHDGTDGMFAMELSDPHHAPGFFARKSYLYVGDMVVCLGSDITSEDTEHPVETTLFQLGLPGEDAPTYIDSVEAETAFPMQWQAATSDPVWLMDHVGNGYRVADPENLHVARHVQNTPWHGVVEPNTTGDFEVGWLNHGPAPEDAGYEYAIYIQTSPAQMQGFVTEPGYRVIQKNARAHIVRHRESGLTGYALFDAGDVKADTLVRRVSIPCLVMTEESSDRCTLSIADPDLRWDAEEIPAVVVTLNGEWELAAERSRLSVTYTDGVTRVTCSTREGRTVQARLVAH